MQTKNYKLDAYAPILCNCKVVLQKQGKNSMQTEELIGPGVAMGNPQDYGVIHYLDDSLLNDYSFPVKKLHHKTISHLFSRVADIRGHKDNICAAKETPNKFGEMCLEIVLSCQNSLSIKLKDSKIIILRLEQILKTIKDRI
jgi:hypothetical protein